SSLTGETFGRAKGHGQETVPQQEPSRKQPFVSNLRTKFLMCGRKKIDALSPGATRSCRGPFVGSGGWHAEQPPGQRVALPVRRASRRGSDRRRAAGAFRRAPGRTGLRRVTAAARGDGAGDLPPALAARAGCRGRLPGDVPGAREKGGL